MSIFTALEALQDLKKAYANEVELSQIFIDFEKQIQQADDTNNCLSLALIIEDIKKTFPNESGLSYFSPKLWLPLDRFFAAQKIYTVIKGLEDCLNKVRETAKGDISAFDLPSIKPSLISGELARNKFQQLHQELIQLTNKKLAVENYEQWQKFSQKTTQELVLDKSAKRSWWQSYQMKYYFEVRQGIKNQLAFAYLFHKHQVKSMTTEFDWRQGATKQTGYGHVTAFVLPAYAPTGDIEQVPSTLKAESAQFEVNRFNKVKDQLQVKHNRLTALIVSSTEKRAKSLLDIAKDNHDQHLKVKLLSRGVIEHYTYLQYKTTGKENKIIFCDPSYGLFQFDDDEAFLFFYQTLYAKEQMQSAIMWNRYQVSNMRYAPDESTRYTWAGMWRSLLTGLKYNSSLIDRAKNFILFNIALMIYLTIGYMITGALTVLSPLVGTLFLLLLVQNNGSMFLTSMFRFGSSGLRSGPDFLYAMCLVMGDGLRNAFGMRASYDAILHKPFELTEINLNRAGSAEMSLKKLNVAPSATELKSPLAKTILVDSFAAQGEVSKECLNRALLTSTTHPKSTFYQNRSIAIRLQPENLSSEPITNSL